VRIPAAIPDRPMRIAVKSRELPDLGSASREEPSGARGGGQRVRTKQRVEPQAAREGPRRPSPCLCPPAPAVASTGVLRLRRPRSR